jgi:hypothetical protein
MNVAYAMHELVSDHIADVIDWLEADGKTELVV